MPRPASCRLAARRPSRTRAPMSRLVRVGFDVVLTAPPDDTGAFAATRLEKLSDAVIEP